MQGGGQGQREARHPHRVHPSIELQRDGPRGDVVADVRGGRGQHGGEQQQQGAVPARDQHDPQHDRDDDDARDGRKWPHEDGQRTGFLAGYEIQHESPHCRVRRQGEQRGIEPGGAVTLPTTFDQQEQGENLHRMGQQVLGVRPSGHRVRTSGRVHDFHDDHGKAAQALREPDERPDRTSTTGEPVDHRAQRHRHSDRGDRVGIVVQRPRHPRLREVQDGDDTADGDAHNDHPQQPGWAAAQYPAGRTGGPWLRTRDVRPSRLLLWLPVRRSVIHPGQPLPVTFRGETTSRGATVSSQQLRRVYNCRRNRCMALFDHHEVIQMLYSQDVPERV